MTAIEIENKRACDAEQRVRELELELGELRKLISHLPKTADGKPIVPGMKVFYPYQGEDQDIAESYVTDTLNLGRIPHTPSVPSTWCWYSSLEAAEASRKK